MGIGVRFEEEIKLGKSEVASGPAYRTKAQPRRSFKVATLDQVVSGTADLKFLPGGETAEAATSGRRTSRSSRQEDPNAEKEYVWKIYCIDTKPVALFAFRVPKSDWEGGQAAVVEMSMSTAETYEAKAGDDAEKNAAKDKGAAEKPAKPARRG
jgi:hypothetical protein